MMMLGNRRTLASAHHLLAAITGNGASLSSIASLQGALASGHQDLDNPVDPISVAAPKETVPLVLRQGTEEWQELRQERLTASTFASALGLWGNYRRIELWEEKLGLRKAFAGNTATDWGIAKEAAAVERYEEITGNNVEQLGFKIYKEGDEGKHWLGASPDGLINRGPSEVYESGGVLEVKCPHTKGKPKLCVPWRAVPYYYVPQLQGLMEILERDWLDFFVWTLNGSALFRFDRDPEYWNLMFEVLHDFWWSSVVPARKLLSSEESGDVNIFKPVVPHKLTPVAIKESRRLAKKASLITKSIS